MISYALEHALSPNRDYRVLPKDCTNFVSQALRAGGWVMKDGPNNSERAWYYRWRWGPLPDEWAHSWTVANHFCYHGTHAFKRLAYVRHSAIWTGDVVQVWFREEDQITHSNVVTGRFKSGWPGIRLSYHSKNKKNVTISWFAAQQPRATYYPLRVL